MGNPSNPDQKNEGIKGCLFPALMGGLLIFLLVLIGGRMNEHSNRKIASNPEPPLPEFEIPQGVPLAYKIADGDRIRYEGVIAAGENEYIICGDAGTNLSIEFETRNSIKHLWSGSGASFTITSPYVKSLAASAHQETWPDLILYEMDSFTPTLNAHLYVEPEYYYTWHSVQVDVDIQYPVPVSAAGYENRAEHLRREFRLYVVSSEDVLRQSAHDAWVQAVANNSGEPSFFYKWFWPLLALAIVLIIVLGLLWR
jgi:hypothetical protein